MNGKYKDKLVGIYAPGNYDHTSVLGQTHITITWKIVCMYLTIRTTL